MLTLHILCEAWNAIFSLEGSALFSGTWLMLLLISKRCIKKKIFPFSLQGLILLLVIGNLNTNFDSAWPPWNLFISAFFPELCVLCCLKTIHSDGFQVFYLLCQRDQLTFMDHTPGGPLRQKVHWWARSSLFPPAEATQLLLASALLQSLESALSLIKGFLEDLGQQFDTSTVANLAVLAALSLYNVLNMDSCLVLWCINMCLELSNNWELTMYHEVRIHYFSLNLHNYHMC